MNRADLASNYTVTSASGTGPTTPGSGGGCGKARLLEARANPATMSFVLSNSGGISQAVSATTCGVFGAESALPELAIQQLRQANRIYEAEGVQLLLDRGLHEAVLQWADESADEGDVSQIVASYASGEDGALILTLADGSELVLPVNEYGNGYWWGEIELVQLNL